VSFSDGPRTYYFVAFDELQLDEKGAGFIGAEIESGYLELLTDS
jgi:hypothetical protein